jgi:hypothetical protein
MASVINATNKIKNEQSKPHGRKGFKHAKKKLSKKEK